MQPIEALTNYLYEQTIDRVPLSEEEIPVQHGPYYYYTRYEKEKQYPIHARKQAEKRAQLSTAPEEIILDLNELALEGEYLSVTCRRLSSDQRLLAYLENRDGTERFTLYFKKPETGRTFTDHIHTDHMYGRL